MHRKKILILCDASYNVGLGHYSRSKILRRIILNEIEKKYLIRIILISNKNIDHLNRNNIISYNKRLIKKIYIKINKFSPNIIFFNLSNFFEKKYFKKLINKIYTKKIKFIGIDNLLQFKKYLSHIWIPNIAIDKNIYNKNVHFGWDRILVDKVKLKNKPKKDILFLIGGTDKYNLAKKIPINLDEKIQKNYKIAWIQGPFAKTPKINKKFRKNWKIYKNPKNVYNIIQSSKCCFVLFGASFYEIVNSGVPLITYIPKGKENQNLINKLKKKFLVETSLKISLNKIALILNNYKKFKKLAAINKKLITLDQRKKFLKNILN
tara:strand:- start:1568 stop:2530 length:963 start_codon:yes stop_codon:yes gene_type:complete